MADDPPSAAEETGEDHPIRDIEIVCQRLALEQQVEEIKGADKMRADLVTSAEKLP